MTLETDLLRNVLTETLEQFALLFGNPAPQGAMPPEAVDYCCARILFVAAGRDCELTLAAPYAMCREMAANVLGADVDDISAEYAEDAIKELENIIAGNLASRQFGDGVQCKIGIPGLRPIDAAGMAALAVRDGTIALLVDDQLVYGAVEIH